MEAAISPGEPDQLLLARRAHRDHQPVALALAGIGLDWRGRFAMGVAAVQYFERKYPSKSA